MLCRTSRSFGPKKKSALARRRRRAHAPGDELQRAVLPRHRHGDRAVAHLQRLGRRHERAQEVVIVDAGEAERALLLAMRLDVADRDARRLCDRGRRSAAARARSSSRRPRRRCRAPAPSSTVGFSAAPLRLTFAAKRTTYGCSGVNVNSLRATSPAASLVLEHQRRRRGTDRQRLGARLEQRVLQRRRRRRIVDVEREGLRRVRDVLRDELERRASAVAVVLQAPALEHGAAGVEDRASPLDSRRRCPARRLAATSGAARLDRRRRGGFDRRGLLGARCLTCRTVRL